MSKAEPIKPDSKHIKVDTRDGVKLKAENDANTGESLNSNRIPLYGNEDQP